MRRGPPGRATPAMSSCACRWQVSPIFKDWLLRHYPDRYRHVMSLVRSMRDGKDYDADGASG